MNLKKLIVLTLVAAGLIALAVVSSHRRNAQLPQAQLGQSLLPSLAVNDVATIRLTGPEGTATVSRASGTWALAEKYGYPASFDRVHRLLTKLADLKAGQLMHVDHSQHEELHLLPLQDVHGTNRDEAATRVELLGAGDKRLATLDVGKTHARAAEENAMYGGYPDSRYVAASDGNVYLVADTLDEVTTSPGDWLDTDFVQVPSSDIAALDVTGGTNGPVHLARQGSGPLSPEPVPAGRELDTVNIDRLSGALGWLRFEDIADPALDRKTTGLANPIVYRATLNDGRIYTLDIGGSPTNDTRRYASVQVEYKAPPPPPVSTNTPPAAAEQDKNKQIQTEEQARTQQAQLSKWTYLLSAASVDAMTVPAADLTKEKPNATPAATNSTMQAEAPKP